MGMLDGRMLTVLALLLAVGALAGAGRVGATGHFGVPVSGEAACTLGEASRAQSLLEQAREAGGRGDVAAALAHYRAAVGADLRLADRKDSRYLGGAFERRLNEWIAGLKGGRIKAGKSALPDAAYLFRRMYGGCG